MSPALIGIGFPNSPTIAWIPNEVNFDTRGARRQRASRKDLQFAQIPHNASTDTAIKSS
jgi:hypothetical protein